jgi:hypothetical protein
MTALAFLVVPAGLTTAGAAQDMVQIPSARTLGPTEMVFDWQRDHCPDGMEAWNWDVPDTPARMWRRKSGETTLIASNNLGSRANIGPDPAHLTHRCDTFYNNTCTNQPWYGGESPCTGAGAIR